MYILCIGNHIFPLLLKYDDITQLSFIYPVEENVTFLK